MGDVVFFDLEATGFGNDSNIIQIGARGPGEDDATFSEFLMPRSGCEIQSAASNVHGIYKTTAGRLYRNGEVLAGVHSQRQGLDMFLDWINDNFDTPVKVWPYGLKHSKMCQGFVNNIIISILLACGLQRLWI